MLPDLIIPAFDAFLADRSLRFDAVIIGGSKRPPETSLNKRGSLPIG